jgi:DNA-binding response OmpR family regulator
MKLLIIEDEYDLNNALSKHLKKNGYGVDRVITVWKL